MTYQRARLTLGRSGGFAGLETTHAVDTDGLEPGRRADYLALLESLDLSKLAAAPTKRPAHPDQFSYDLRLDLDGTRRRLHFGDSTDVAGLKSLVQMITADSRN